MPPNARPTLIYDPDEPKLLRTAAALALLKTEHAMRLEEGGVYRLFFPGEVKQEDEPTADEEKDVLFHLSGAADHLDLFAALVVRLARSGFFRLTSTRKRRAFFQSPADDRCSLALEPSETGSTLVLAFARGTSEETRLRFDEYVHSQLRARAHASGFQRERRFHCPSCGWIVGDHVAVANWRVEGRTSIYCGYCGESVPILDRAEMADESQHAAIAKMNRVADARRELDVAALTLRGKALANSYDAFFVNHPADEERVNELRVLLREQGILVWHDKARLKPGAAFKRTINEATRASRVMVFFIGNPDLSTWLVAEALSTLEAARKANTRLFNVLLRDGAASLMPPPLRDFPVINMPGFTPAAMEQLVEAITGRGGAYVDPNAAQPTLSPTHTDIPSLKDTDPAAPRHSQARAQKRTGKSKLKTTRARLKKKKK